jgi:hypothetical protein
VHSGARASVVEVVVVDVVSGAGVEVQAIRPVDGWRAGTDELVQAVSISVMATAATRPIRRIAHSYSTSAWHPVRRVGDHFDPDLTPAWLSV